MRKISFNDISPGNDFKNGIERLTAYKKSYKIKRSVKKSLKELFTNKRYLNNLVICTWLWMAAFMQTSFLDVYEGITALSDDCFNA